MDSFLANLTGLKPFSLFSFFRFIYLTCYQNDNKRTYKVKETYYDQVNKME